MTVAQETAARSRLDWALLARQVGGLVRLELRRLLLTRRAVILGLASAIPVGIVLLVGSIPIGGQTVLERFGNRIVYETIFETVFLGAILFFGCLYVFFNLFRGEILERSLHYLLLTPLRREVVVAAKYAAAVTAVAVLFMASTVFSYALIYLPVGFSGSDRGPDRRPGRPPIWWLTWGSLCSPASATARCSRWSAWCSGTPSSRPAPCTSGRCCTSCCRPRSRSSA